MNNKKPTERVHSKDSKKKPLNLTKKESNNEINGITKIQNMNNKLEIKLGQLSKNKSRKNRIIPRKNNLNKLDYLLSNTYYFNNKSLSINFNKSNHNTLNITDYNFKEKYEKNKPQQTLNQYKFSILPKNMERLNTLELNDDKIYKRLIKNKNSISLINKDYLFNKQKNRKMYNSLNKNKQNISINNNIIININNNNQYDSNINLDKSIQNNKIKVKSQSKHSTLVKKNNQQKIIKSK